MQPQCLSCCVCQLAAGVPALSAPAGGKNPDLVSLCKSLCELKQKLCTSVLQRKKKHIVGEMRLGNLAGGACLSSSNSDFQCVCLL